MQVWELNLPWRFKKGRLPRTWRKEEENEGRSVILPHSWNEQDTFQEGLRYYRGKGSYQNAFVLNEVDPAARYFLESEGFYGEAKLWLNGKYLGKHDGNYLGLRVDVSKALRVGKQVLAVELDNDCSNDVLPGIREPDFVLHGGLAGRVFLRKVPSTYLLRETCRLRPRITERQQAIVDVELALHSRNKKKQNGEYSCQVLDESGKVLGECKGLFDIEGKASGVLKDTISLKEAQLWTLDNPCLYRVRVELCLENGEKDFFEKEIGFREIAFEADRGFFLNGEHVFLRGINRHESVPGFGNALPLAFHEDEVRKIKKMGFNLVRCSHYPQHPHFLQACDRLGLLVYEEIATWKSVRAGRWLKNAKIQMKRMLLRDRHHPSIILWGMGNEARARRPYKKLGKLIKRIDPDRFSIYAENHLYRAKRKETFASSDVYGSNYELDVLPEARRLSRNKVILISEMSNCPRQRGDDLGELEQVEVIKQDVTALKHKPYVAGFTLWCWRDYATMRKRRYLRYSGVCDAWGLPKMAASYLQTQGREELHAAVYGDWGNDEAKAWRPFHIFSNAEKVHVFVGDEKIAARKGDGHYLSWVPFQNKPLRIVAEYYGDEQEICVLQPHGRGCVTKVELTKQYASRDEMVTEWRIFAVDAEEKIDRNWNGELQLEVSGDVRTCTYDEKGSVKLARGEGRFFLKAKITDSFSFSVKASAAGKHALVASPRYQYE